MLQNRCRKDGTNDMRFAEFGLEEAPLILSAFSPDRRLKQGALPVPQN